MRHSRQRDGTTRPERRERRTPLSVVRHCCNIARSCRGRHRDRRRCSDRSGGSGGGGGSSGIVMCSSAVSRSSSTRSAHRVGCARRPSNRSQRGPRRRVNSSVAQRDGAEQQRRSASASSSALPTPLLTTLEGDATRLDPIHRRAAPRRRARPSAQDAEQRQRGEGSRRSHCVLHSRRAWHTDAPRTLDASHTAPQSDSTGANRSAAQSSLDSLAVHSTLNSQTGPPSVARDVPTQPHHAAAERRQAGFAQTRRQRCMRDEQPQTAEQRGATAVGRSSRVHIRCARCHPCCSDLVRAEARHSLSRADLEARATRRS